MYRLTAKSVSVNIKPDAFRPDMTIPKTCRAELSDYRRSGYDRGHLAPCGHGLFNSVSKPILLLSNIAPQTQD